MKPLKEGSLIDWSNAPDSRSYFITGWGVVGPYYLVAPIEDKNEEYLAHIQDVRGVK